MEISIHNIHTIDYNLIYRLLYYMKIDLLAYLPSNIETVYYEIKCVQNIWKHIRKFGVLNLMMNSKQ